MVRRIERQRVLRKADPDIGAQRAGGYDGKQTGKKQPRCDGAINKKETADVHHRYSCVFDS
jgi:hypothetical protein